MTPQTSTEPLRASLLPPAVEADTLVLDRDARLLRGPAGEAPLPSRVFRVAEKLMRAPGAFVSHEALMDALYGGSDLPDSAEVRLRDAIGGLRAAVARAAGAAATVSVSRGVGYALLATRPAMEQANE